MNDTKVITGKVRFCYLNVFSPKASDDGKEKYSVCILIPKSDTKTIEKVKKAIEAAKQIGKAKLIDKKGNIPANIKTPLRDGDIDRADDPAFENCWFINANSTHKPGIVDKDLNEIMTQSDFYSGCYGRASLNFYAYNVDSKGTSKGIAASLNNLQKLEDGEVLDGSSSAEDDFGGDNSWGDDDDELM